jgi:hypothetical protein
MQAPTAPLQPLFCGRAGPWEAVELRLELAA